MVVKAKQDVASALSGGKRGKASRYFSLEGGLMLAVRARVGNATSATLGIVLGVDVHGTTIGRYEVASPFFTRPAARSSKIF